MTSVSHNELTQDCTLSDSHSKELPKELPEEVIERLQRLENRPEDDILNTEALRIVRAVWPFAFNVIAPAPLKIGIHKDMEDETAGQIPAFIISKALRFFTTLDRYLAMIQPGAPRLDLSGNAVGKVKLREAVDAEIKRYQQSQPKVPERERIIIKQIRLVAVNNQPR